MGFFHKKIDTGSERSLYSVGFNKTLLLVGLGNIGGKYAHTRHNVGFQCLDFFAKTQEFPDWHEKRDLKCYLTKHNIGDTSIILIKPTTMMNLSGEAVQATCNFYKIPAAHVTVVHDELDIPFGQIRTRQGGGAAGHNGIKSIISRIGEDFGRIRIGISNSHPDQMETSDYVLASFTEDEQKELLNLQKETASLLTEFLYSGQLPAETRRYIL